MARNISSVELSKQDEYLLANIKNMINFAGYAGKSKFSCFLDERQQQLAKRLLSSSGFSEYCFFGGAEECTRTIFGVFPDSQSVTYDAFPITSLKLNYSSKAVLSHSDILGAIMGLQIERDCVGDIIIDNTSTVVFVTDEISDFLIQNLNKAGRYNLTVTICDDEPVKIEHKFSEIKGSVASMRLDCIVAFLLNKSRTISVEKILSKCVKLNCFEAVDPSQKVSSGDVIVIRGSGKYIIGEDISLTKKSRLFITAKKYI